MAFKQVAVMLKREAAALHVKKENKKSLGKDEVIQSNSKLQNHWIKCGNYNPAGSAFCNKGGFALR